MVIILGVFHNYVHKKFQKTLFIVFIYTCMLHIFNRYRFGLFLLFVTNLHQYEHENVHFLFIESADIGIPDTRCLCVRHEDGQGT